MSQSHLPYRRPAELVEAGLIDAAALAAVEQAATAFPLLLPRQLAALIDPADPADPIARQFVPQAEEMEIRPEDRADPIGDQTYSPQAGIVHRYPDRVLLTPLLTCAAHCRFCFRRTRVGDTAAAMSPAEIDAALAYIAARPEVREVVITGGDPLMLGPRRIGLLLAALAGIAHLDVVRFHTRLPVVAPDRIDAAMVAALCPPPQAGFSVWLAVQINHARELAPATAQALARLTDTGLPLLAQTVLLKGVNDSAATLEALFRALVRQRVRPYYLHHPDLAPGTGHFRPSLAEGRALMRTLRGRLSGIALPTYVLDIPGGFGKVPVGPDYWDEDSLTVTDPSGRRHSRPQG
ncbi:lysine-2,3-aminomutase-like protein [Magnetospirillum molischianum]|uniref:Putative lysine 2,3-aminomutase n=1 Tax=Magnetospirillum molischianum DSM 120 TaxID=1150626 RepID=H8FSH7_MAGML|nr:lysine-2,3-aminomutase-like protein [Magnetospirillum molischianum]CCG41315.1 putative lysine 2,3-aminomutase [Magnetospirillum molischianum DSM 120]